MIIINIFFTFLANILILGQGCAIGWVAPTIHILLSDQAPLPIGQITKHEASWIGSLSSIGAAIGTLGFGLLTLRIGSRNTTIICAIPLIVSF